MGRLLKIITVLVAVIVVIIVGLATFIHFYLTEGRLKALIIPQAERSLGRKIDVGSIKAGLFTGIVIKDVTIKEADGKTDFARLKAFVLRYSLLPLLHKNLEVNTIVVDSPFVRLIREKDGRFNYESLGFLSKPAHSGARAPRPMAPSSPPASEALPLILTVDRIHIKDAKVELLDKMGEIPETDAKADMKLSLKLGRDISSMKYDGELIFSITSRYGNLNPLISGNSKFNQKVVDFSIDLLTDGQRISLTGQARDYLKAPNIRLDVTSEEIDLDKLLAAAASLPSGKGAATPRKPANGKEKPTTKETGMANRIQANGKLDLKKIVYSGVVMRNLMANYQYKDQRLTIKDISAQIADGTINSAVAIDLKKTEPAYQGNLLIKGVNLGKIMSDLSLTKRIGALSAITGLNLTFSGEGSTWPVLRQTLSARGDYHLKDVKIEETPITKAISLLLGLKELNKLQFDTIEGNLKIYHGNVLLKSEMSGSDISASADGKVGLDGRLDMPLTIGLGPKFTKRLKSRASITRYLITENGQTVISLRLVGTVSKPIPRLNMTAIKKRAEKEIKKKAFQVLEKALDKKSNKKGQPTSGTNNKGTPAGQLLKEFFGR